MQKKYGFASLGAADGQVKTAIFGGNNATLYDQSEEGYARLQDKLTALKADYEKEGPARSNRRRFIPEFKLEAVRLIRDRGVSYAQASPAAQSGEGICGRSAARVPGPGSAEAGTAGERVK
jgi:hypothetical protein